MPTTIHTDLIATGQRHAIVCARWNDFISERLVAGAVDALVRHGVAEEDILIVRVPGSFELPMGAQQVARRDDIDAVTALGTLIRGATPHFDHISAEATKGIAQVAMETDKPVSYGLITADSLEQAIERAGTKAGNKGAEAALAAIELVNLYRALKQA